MAWDILKVDIHNKWRTKWFETHPYDIAEYSWNYLFTGGKEIRPRIFCELWNYLSPDSEIISELAFAIECIHVASIILDDTPWMDNASERRGRKTLHNVFSLKKAALIAYDVIDMAIEIWTNNVPRHIDIDTWINLLKYKLQRLVIGQLYDLEKSGSLVELASLKTGVLFELVTETVALCVGLDTTFWRIWGNNLGILFQWVDDFLDMEEDKIQDNRNAFNESYDETIKMYETIWTMIEKGIGKQWFETNIGIFMKDYFKTKFKFNDELDSFSTLLSIAIVSPADLSITKYNCVELFPPSINKNVNDYLKSISTDDKLTPINMTYLEGIINSKVILRYLWSYLDNIYKSKTIKHNLWSKDESEWERYTAKEYGHWLQN
jgi:geranylgeranyl pyrophosphate synthase